jgi:hypothetical protein
VARFIGHIVGPHTHLLLGIDFVSSRYSETNFAPSGGVFAVCYMQGKGTRTERYIAMLRERALTNSLLNIAGPHGRLIPPPQGYPATVVYIN